MTVSRCDDISSKSLLSLTCSTHFRPAWIPAFHGIDELTDSGSKFWHQCNRIHLQGVASFTGRDLLGLGPGILRRYTITTLVFAISGLYHRLVDNLMGIDWHKSGGLTAFLLIVPGILLEDFVQTCWNRAAAPKRLSAKTRSLLERIVGYLWVFSWLMLVTPIYNYPIMRIDPDNSLKLYVIPWSLVNWLRQWK